LEWYVRPGFFLVQSNSFLLTGNLGFEYWFPRPHPPSFTASDEKREYRHPLIILGGARETLREKGYGMYESNDAVLDLEASEGLRKFLPAVFPGKFGPEATVEVEWVRGTIVACHYEIAYDEAQTGIMGFTKSGAPFVSQPLSSLRSPAQGYNRSGESLMPTRSLLPGSTSLQGTQGTECLEHMDGENPVPYPTTD
jgi:hypothetical protein